MNNLLFFNYDLLKERTTTDITLEEQYVRAYIAYRAGNGIPGKNCFASVETISKDLGISENTTRKYLKILKAAKHIIELPYRSEYGTKQYIMNDNNEWIPITNNFRNAYKNIEGIKTKKRKQKIEIGESTPVYYEPELVTSTVEAFCDTLKETQFLNPNSIKEFNYSSPKISKFEVQENLDQAPENRNFYENSSDNEDSQEINWEEFGLGGTIEDFGGSFTVSKQPVIESVEPELDFDTYYGEGVIMDDFEDVYIEPAPAPKKMVSRKKSAFDMTPDIEEQLTDDEKIEIECALIQDLKEAKEEQPKPELPVQEDKRTSAISDEIQNECIRIFGAEVMQYLDYPYLLLKFIKEKREEWAVSRAEYERELNHQINNPSTLDSVTEPIDEFGDCEVIELTEEEIALHNATHLTEEQYIEEIIEEEKTRWIGLNLHNQWHVRKYLEMSNVTYNNDRRHYEIIIREEVMDRFFPIFADGMKRDNGDIKFDHFIEFCMILAANEMKWETNRYNDSTVSKLIEPWVPSKFQADKYKQYTKEQLIDVAFRDNIELLEHCSFNDMMIRAEQLEIDAKNAGMTVEEYQKKLRQDALKESQKESNKENNYYSSENDF